MSYLIRDSKQLKGTAYIELYPDRFSGSHWNSNSIYLEEYHWELLRPALQRHFPDYDPYGFQTINSSVWELVISDFTTLSERISNGAKAVDIRDQISYLSQNMENDFLSDEDSNLRRLKLTLDELGKWIAASIQKSGFVSVLGL